MLWSIIVLFSIALAADSTDQINIVVQNEILSRPLPSDFVSFSFEVGGAKEMLWLGDGARPSMVNLARLLASAATGGDDSSIVRGPNIRVGGYSTDESVWLPAPSPLPKNDTYRITIADLRAYAVAIPLFNGTITPGLNFRDAVDPSLALGHLKALTGQLPWTHGSSEGLLAAVEIGNECDLYFKDGLRNSSFTFADYDSEFSSYIEAAAPLFDDQPRIQGGTFCCFFEAGIVPYMKQHRAVLASFSQHQYALRNCGRPKPNANTVYDLLNNSASAGRAAHVAPFARAAAALELDYFIGEGNNVACGGQYNVSDTTAAALWAIDTLLHHAAVGVRRWNWHTGPSGAYSMIRYARPLQEDVADVQPLFYGMWMAAESVARSSVMLRANTHSSNDLIQAHAARDSNGATRVTLIHKDANATAVATACISLADTPTLDPVPTARLLRLLAPSVHSHYGLTLGNQTLDGAHDGKPRGGPRVWESVQWDQSRACYVLDVPPVSAALLVIPPMQL